MISDEQCFQDLKKSAIKTKKEKVTAKMVARVYAEATPPSSGGLMPC